MCSAPCLKDGRVCEDVAVEISDLIVAEVHSLDPVYNIVLSIINRNVSRVFEIIGFLLIGYIF
jgi:hypothetical protein